MLQISILERTDTSILYELPAGKPDPRQPCTTGHDTRNRVMQTACKSGTCWYYVFNFIRKRIGTNPCKELLQEREIEKLYSSHRKALTRVDESHMKEEQFFNGIDTERARFFINNKEKLQTFLKNAVSPDLFPNMFALLEEFLKESKYTNMDDFLRMKKLTEGVEITTEFLAKKGIDVTQFSETWSCCSKEDERTDRELSEVELKSSFLDALVISIAAVEYGLQKSGWTLVSGITGLLQELKRAGPLAIGGAFGPPAYVEAPFKMREQISGRDIYAWRPGAKRHPTRLESHSVLLIGAKKTQDKALVYFIDPTDPSDPQDRSSQKIYMISFANLTSNISDLHNRLNPESPFGYAHHGSFQIYT